MPAASRDFLITGSSRVCLGATVEATVGFSPGVTVDAFYIDEEISTVKPWHESCVMVKQR
ncbi:hypothetical protein GCM10028784_11510 [Myceligenerans cantabricum]